MTKDEALRLALEALETLTDCYDNNAVGIEIDAIKAIKEALETKDEPVAWEQFYPDIGKPQIAFNAEVVVYVAPQRTWVELTDEDMNNALDYWSDNSRSSYGGAHAANGEYVDMIETWRYIEAKLKEKNMNSLPRYNEKAELDTRLRVDPVTGDVGIGTPKLETKNEPVGWIDSKGNMICTKINESCRPLYTTPQQRTWVGLTDEEKAQFVVAYYPSNWDRKTAVSLMSDYEKYLKEKNHV